ncbi:MAG: ATP-dependent protease La [Bdellovibrio sp.]|nr:MAG: ATP-dependent protease La [Bdellovibrio sp.]
MRRPRRTKTTPLLTRDFLPRKKTNKLSLKEMKLFVFPLGQSLLHPGSSKPLNVYEPRYLRMVRDSLDENTPIAVGFGEQPELEIKTENGMSVPFLREVVGFGYPEVLEQRMDGSMLILIPCEGKARLGPIVDDRRPYLVVEGRRVEEKTELEASHAIAYLNLQRLLVRWIGTHIQDQQIQDQFVNTLRGPIEVVGAAVSYLVKDADLQQEILELNDINGKIDFIGRVLVSGGL